jgi:hypothetical protein
MNNSKISLQQPKDIQFRTISYQSKPVNNKNQRQDGLAATMLITDGAADMFDSRMMFNSI